MAGNCRSGRRPAPAALKILRGNPGKRRLPAHEPQPAPPDASFDRPPDELAGDRVARAEWARVAPMLRAARIATTAERGILIALCQQWSRYREAQTEIRRRGLFVRSRRGQKQNPYLPIADRALAACVRLWTELGLTPSARARVVALPAAEQPEPKKWAELL